MAGAQQDQKAADPLELELQMVVNYYVDSEKQTWVLYKNSKCSYPLNHLRHTYAFKVLWFLSSKVKI